MTDRAHVYPTWETIRHNLESTDCPCEPRMRDGLVIHDSFRCLGWGGEHSFRDGECVICGQQQTKAHGG